MGQLTAVLRKKDGEFSVNNRGESVVYIRYSHQSKEVFFSTGVLCHPKSFDIKSGFINSVKGSGILKKDTDKIKYLKNQDAVCNKKISKLKDQIQSIINDLDFSGENPSAKLIKNIYTKGGIAGRSFWNKFEEYDEFRKANDKKNTYKQVPTLKKSLQEFEQTIGYTLDFENIDLPLLKRYATYLSKTKKHSPNYTGYFVKALKTFLNSCISEGIQLKFNLKDLKKPVEIKSIIFLTEEELTSLYRFNYEFSRHRKAVDLFTVQSYTGFRISDFKRLDSSHMQNDEIFIHRSIKTDRPMQVPMIGPTKDILEKYGYSLPIIAESNYNLYIKEAAAIAIPNSKMEIIKVIDHQKKVIIEKKHKLLTTHVAIKTFITMAYARGASVEAIAKITGKSEAVIRKHYLQFSIKDASDELKKVFK